MDGEYWVLVLVLVLGVSVFFFLFFCFFTFLCSVCILFVIRVCVCIDVIIYVVYSLIFSFLFSRPQVSIRRLERQKRRELKGQERSSLSERLFFVFVYYGILFYFYS